MNESVEAEGKQGNDMGFAAAAVQTVSGHDAEDGHTQAAKSQPQE